MIIGLASPPLASSVDEALDRIEQSVSDAASRGARIVCLPEAYLPGLRGLDFDVAPFDRAQQERALEAVATWARQHRIAVVLGLERHTDAGRQIAAAVFDAGGALLGWQTKNQLDPTEVSLYVPGETRRIFEVDGLRFGVAICHEGFRYPETVRWAAVRGAQVVFHPHCTGSDRQGVTLTEWGAAGHPYYEKAVMCRSLENTIYMASVNYAFRYQESATAVIAPSGACVARLPYGQPGVLVHDIDLAAATGLLASRYAPERYRDAGPA
ncbi:MAG: carbon-nitrogen hydrolase family protein [Acidobacteriota bacterium]|nr:carbon-nitrogen hydrolase family protein [Acidobacteriota bacterium]